MEIYLDANATTPVLAQAAQAALQAMADDFGNPSSVHCTGLKARAIVDSVRAHARRLLDTGDGRLVFVSGATEGIQTAVLSALQGLSDPAQACLLLYGATEHKAVPEALHHWNQLLRLGMDVKAIPVDVDGRHDLDFLRRHAPKAGLVCTMAANNETGVISDLAGIEAALNDSGSPAFWMVDGVQALGKLPLRLQHSRIDYAPFSGHKLYAPKGIGMLYVRQGAPFTPLLAGGGQEDSLRSGTENMSGIAALGAVLAALEDGRTFRDCDTLIAFRDRLRAALVDALPGVVFNAPLHLCLPTTLNFSVPGLGSRLLQDLFDAADVRVSGGSACSAAKAQPSFVLQAMGLPEWQAAGAVRLSFGPAVDEAFISEACARLRACGESLRRNCLSPQDNTPTAGDGITRFTHEGACCYLLADAASRSCLLIDPQPEQVDRLAQALACQGYPLLSVLSTRATPGDAQARTALAVALGTALAPALQSSAAAGSDGTAPFDAFGWPAGTDKLTVGRYALRRHPLPGELQALRVSERSGQNGEEVSDCASDWAFASDTTGLASFIGPHTLVLPTRDPDQRFATTLASEAEAADAQGLPALEGSQLPAFIAAHPDALLVDVREPFEQFLGQIPELPGLHRQAVPLSRLLNALPAWLAAPRPLLFFCRSGNRSRQAALALTRLGHPNARTLAGGLALWPASAAVTPSAATAPEDAALMI